MARGLVDHTNGGCPSAVGPLMARAAMRWLRENVVYLASMAASF
jgi:hypothetical protein